MVNRETDYDYDPYFTNAGTGKLFRAPKNTITDKARWPRGFTPERLHEVGRAVGDVEFRTDQGLTHHPSKRYQSTASKASISPSGGMSVDPGVEPPLLRSAKRDLGEGAAAIRETLARSKVPTSDIEDVTFSVTPDLPYNGLFAPGERRLHFGRDSEDVDFYSRQVIPEEESLRGKTVVHEMGHATDPALRNPTSGRNDILWAGKPLGELEERADDYMVENYVPDRRGRTYGTMTTSYPGRKPAHEAPEQYAGYSSWGERSKMAAAEIRGRVDAAGPEGRIPMTAEQRDYLANDIRPLSRDQFDRAAEQGSLF